MAHGDSNPGRLQVADPGGSAEILFCPFCREAFAAHAVCPEHELALLPFEEIPSAPRPEVEAVTFFADPRLGRGPVLFGAMLVLTGFVAPLVRSRAVSASALEVAIDGAGNLWLTAGAAITLCWILWRRRDGFAMTRARVAVLGLALGGTLPLLYTTWRIRRVAEALTAEVEWRWGLWVMAAGFLVVALCSRGLGRRRGVT